MKVAIKKEQFLANAKNKQQLIEMLRQRLAKKGCTTNQADGDADVLIVQIAVKTFESKHITLLGDDTDLIVLLCYYYTITIYQAMI